MSTQPEPLRLVDVAFAARDGRWHTQADDELRRLHVDDIETAAELRGLHQFAEDQIGRATAAEAALQMTKATHALKIAAVEAQRDALLEALKLASAWVEEYISQMRAYTISEQADDDLSVIYAAIAAAEEGK